jgi:hypothetical protein
MLCTHFSERLWWGSADRDSPRSRYQIIKLKILTAGRGPDVAKYGHAIVRSGAKDMGIEKTCAACDCKLDEGAIKVKLGGRIVEVCCDECARKLKEAHTSAGNQ